MSWKVLRSSRSLLPVLSKKSDGAIWGWRDAAEWVGAGKADILLKLCRDCCYLFSWFS
jgi:hypothetical protein